MILQRHMETTLQIQFMHIRDPVVLCAELNARFKDQEMLYLPQARADWANFCVMDFSKILAYDEELHRIVSNLRVCGEPVSNGEMIEKTLSTVPPARISLAQNIRHMKIKKYSKLIQQLMLAKTQHQTMMRDSELRPLREIHNTQVGEPNTAEPAQPAPTSPTKDEVGNSKAKIEGGARC